MNSPQEDQLEELNKYGVPKWLIEAIETLISDTVAKAEREARLHTLGGVLNLNNGRTFSESTDWKQEYARILAIVNKRWEDTRDELKPQQKDEE